MKKKKQKNLIRAGDRVVPINSDLDARVVEQVFWTDHGDVIQLRLLNGPSSTLWRANNYRVVRTVEEINCDDCANQVKHGEPCLRSHRKASHNR